MQVKLRSIVKGAATRVPLVSRLANSSTGGSVSARYCYSVWLRHLSLIAPVHSLDRVHCLAELGPGDSLGIGLAGMLSGIDKYFGLDRKPFADVQQNLKILDELLLLFANRERIPDDREFPGVFPKLDSYDFPAQFLDDYRLERSLSTARVVSIRRALQGIQDPVGLVEIRYFAPWDGNATIRPESVDWIFSQAVLEHVDNVPDTYRNLTKWLRPTGLMSHTIDYSSHGLTRDWYGHWTVSTGLWKLIRGRRAYLINRLPHSAHIDALRANDLKIIRNDRIEAAGPPRVALATGVHDFTDADLSTATAFVVAGKQSSRSIS